MTNQVPGLDAHFNSLLAAYLRDEEEYERLLEYAEEHEITLAQAREIAQRERDEYLYDLASDMAAWEDL